MIDQRIYRVARSSGRILHFISLLENSVRGILSISIDAGKRPQ
jgi:hypothetical protein